jgi:hypothetical protein
MLWVRDQRHRHRIPDRYGRIPEAPKAPGQVEDGRRALLTMDRDNDWQLRILPAEWHRDDESINVQVQADEEVKYLEKKLARLRKNNPGFRFDVASRDVAVRESETFSFNFSIDRRLWPRFAAKVALNVGREIRGAEWLFAPHARRLHEILWDRDKQTGMRPFPTRQVPWTAHGWSASPNHILMAANTQWGPFLNLALFGEDSYGVPLGDPPLEQGWVWVLHTHSGLCERLSEDDFLMRVVLGSRSHGDRAGH